MERSDAAKEMAQRIRDYASDETGLQPGSLVLSYAETGPAQEAGMGTQDPGSYTTVVDGALPKPGQRIVYLDGGFDLFSSGHIEFLRQVVKAEEAFARQTGWYDDTPTQKERRAGNNGGYGPTYIVAGIHDDEVINHWKGVNYPIMNIFERGLLVLQCRVCGMLDLILCVNIGDEKPQCLIINSTFMLLSSRLLSLLQKRIFAICHSVHPMPCTTGRRHLCHSRMTLTTQRGIWVSTERLETTISRTSMPERLYSVFCGVGRCTRRGRRKRAKRPLAKKRFDEEKTWRKRQQLWRRKGQ